MIILIILCICLFSVWTFLMIQGHLTYLDQKVYHFFKIKNRTTILFKIITTFANTKYFIVVCFLLFFFLNKKLAITISTLMLINAILVSIFKHIIRRERPNINRLVFEKGYSYPSGHTMSATSMYGFFIFLILISTLYLPLKVLLASFFFLLIIFIGISRIYLGVHYFSDVIGAIFLGSSYVLIYVYFVYYVLNII